MRTSPHLRSAALALALGSSAAAAAAPPHSCPGVCPTLRTETEGAAIQAQGLLDAELGYRLDFAGAGTYDVHHGELLLGYGITPAIEARLGWHVFSVVESDAFDELGGLGNPYLDGKFRLAIRDIDAPHALSLRGRAELGLARELGTRGLTLGAAALYSVQLGTFVVDANAGLDFNTAQSPAYFALPLSGRATWSPRPWLDVFAEFVEALRLDALRGSETALSGGVGFRPADMMTIDLSAGAGLSSTVPGGRFQVVFGFLTRPPSR